MSKSKKILYISTLSILILLIICTFLSKFIAEAIMPVVEVISPVSMKLSITDDNGESYEREFERVIPNSAIITGAFNQKYVYITRQNRGLFGLEYIVRLLEVQVIADNGIYAAIEGWNVTILDNVVISPPNNLTSGEVVKVIIK